MRFSCPLSPPRATAHLYSLYCAVVCCSVHIVTAQLLPLDEVWLRLLLSSRACLCPANGAQRCSRDSDLKASSSGAAVLQLLCALLVDVEVKVAVICVHASADCAASESTAAPSKLSRSHRTAAWQSIRFEREPRQGLAPLPPACCHCDPPHWDARTSARARCHGGVHV